MRTTRKLKSLVGAAVATTTLVTFACGRGDGPANESPGNTTAKDTQAPSAQPPAAPAAAPASAPAAAPSPTPAPADAAASLKEGSGGELLGLALKALQSAGVAAPAGASLALLDDKPEAVSAKDPLCSNKGNPWDASTAGVMSSSKKGYVQALFYCLLNSKAYESVDTIPGALKQTQSIFCSIEKKFGVTKDSYTAEGAQLVTTAPADIPLTADCWDQGTPGGLTSVTMKSVIAKKLAESTGFQYELKMESDMLDPITLRIFNSKGVFGFAKLEAGTAPGIGGYFSLTVDTVKGVILANEVNDRNREQDPYRTLTRLRAKGEIDKATGAFGKVTEAKGYQVRSGPGFTAVADDAFVYSVYEASGSEADGFRFRSGSNNTNEASPVTFAEGDCYGEGKTCASATAIGTPAELQTAMRGGEAVKTAWETMFTSGLPLCEPAAGGVVTYAVTPESTGKLGVCE